MEDLKFPKPKIFRSEHYLNFIRLHACIICRNPNTIAHHEGLGRNAIGRKPADSHAVPLCVACHDRRHSHGVDTFWDGWDMKMHIIELLGEFLRGKI